MNKQSQRGARPRNLNRGDNGRTVRVGSIVIDDGPTWGKVIFVRDGAVVYRALDGKTNWNGGNAIPASAAELTVLS